MRIGFAKIDSKERLQLYGDTKGKFRMQYVTKIRIHPYLVEEKYGAYLFRDLYDITNEANIYVCKSIWLNRSKTIDRLHLEPGDIIEGMWYSELYKYGREYHRLNTTRAEMKTYRLLYPSEVSIVAHEELPKDRIIALNNMRKNNQNNNNERQVIFNTLEEYHATLKGCSKINEEYGLIHLWDLTDYSQLFTKRGELRNSFYRPKLLFESIWNELSEEQQFILGHYLPVKYKAKIEERGEELLLEILGKTYTINPHSVYEDIVRLHSLYYKKKIHLEVSNIDYYVQLSLKQSLK